MLEPPSLGLPIVSGDELGDGLRACLRPGETIEDAQGVPRRLPMYYYRVPSWKTALSVKLAPNFGLWELIDVDVREAEPMRSFPRYIPCAITVLAAHLQILRNEVGRVIRIAANGGYRSPGHRLSPAASPHLWGSAANIYRIGDELIDSKEKVERYAQIVRSLLPSVRTRPWGQLPGYSFDHLHVDLGYVLVEPGDSTQTPPESPEEA
jgi:hypothetical protein